MDANVVRVFNAVGLYTVIHLGPLVFMINPRVFIHMWGFRVFRIKMGELMCLTFRNEYHDLKKIYNEF